MIRRIFKRKPKRVDAKEWAKSIRPDSGGMRADTGVVGCNTCFNEEPLTFLPSPKRKSE